MPCCCVFCCHYSLRQRLYFILKEWFTLRFIYTSKVIERSHCSCKNILRILWCGGLICGIMAAACAGNLTSLMLTFCQNRVSIVSLLIVPLFPFLISAFAVFYFDFRFLYPVCFLKAFSLGFTARLVMDAFGSAGWLVCGMLLFTDIMTAPALLYAWLRFAERNRSVYPKVCIGCIAWFVIIVLSDHGLIAPLLKQIL